MTNQADYITDDAQGEGWRIMLGDSCERLAELPDESIDMSVASPPFDSLFTYSPSVRDLGNSASRADFLDHYRFIVEHQLRLMKPGRIACIHVQQITTTKATHGHVGMTDFRGDVIRLFQDVGWIFHGETTVWKDPQPLRDGTPVLTPGGWVPIESLSAGDSVIGQSGRATEVVDVPYRGVQPIYRVTTSDGVTIECGPEHLWTVRNGGKSRQWVTKRTDELVSTAGRVPSGAFRWELPTVDAVEFGSTAELPVHPLTMGAMLADGSWSGQPHASLTKDASYVESLPLPEGHSWVRRPGSDRAEGRTATFGITSARWHDNRVIEAMRNLGLADCRAWEKFIPAPYLLASVDDRRALLAGLMNGDGRRSSTGALHYRTTSERLADDVVELVRSLGGHARIDVRDGGMCGDGRRGRPLYEVSVRLTFDPFTLSRKAGAASRRTPRRYIASIETVPESAPMTCITVAADDGLFVTDGYVVTHNSQSIRTKSFSLAFQTKNRDSASSRPALADYLLIFRKPGENAVKIAHQADSGEVTNNDWIEWASPIWTDATEGGWLTDDGHLSPVWFGIRESDTLNVRVAREAADERHIAPLQLEFIRRCILLYSNPGETILTPFAGIGSELYVALKNGRCAIGCELKPSYWRTAVDNLRRLESELSTPTLLDELDAS